MVSSTFRIAVPQNNRVPEDSRDSGVSIPAQSVQGKTSSQTSLSSGSAAKASRWKETLCFVFLFFYFNLTDFLGLTLLLKYKRAVRCEMYRADFLLFGHVTVVPAINGLVSVATRPVRTTCCNANPAFSFVICYKVCYNSHYKSNENFKTAIPSKIYDRPKTTRECEIF